MDTFELVKTLSKAFGPSGQEDEIRSTIKELAKPFADEIRTDVMGNLIVRKKGRGPKLMLAAHMDSVGFIVSYIEDSGLLRFGTVGGISPDKIPACPVRFANGTVGTVGWDEDLKKPETDKMFIDIGTGSREEAEKLVRPGDMAVYDTLCRAAGNDCVISPFLDNRTGCAAQLAALSQIKEPCYDCYFVFTVQEEVGLRGAKPAAFSVAPDLAIACDATLTDDLPGTKHAGTSKTGGGASIKVMDKSVICHPEMVSALKKTAEDCGVPYQTDVLTRGGTDASEMRKSAGGVYTGGISIPVRYVHSPQELCSLKDIESAARLIAAFCTEGPAESLKDIL